MMVKEICFIELNCWEPRRSQETLSRKILLITKQKPLCYIILGVYEKTWWGHQMSTRKDRRRKTSNASLLCCFRQCCGSLLLQLRCRLYDEMARKTILPWQTTTVFFQSVIEFAWIISFASFSFFERKRFPAEKHAMMSFKRGWQVGETA